MIRIILVDDHTIIRDGIRALLSDQEGLEVVGEAGNGQDLLALLATTPTDVVLMDMNMPVMDGMEATKRLREEYPQVHVLALSMLDHEEYINRMFEAGAYGYVLKNAGKLEIVYAIRTVANGRQFLCSELGVKFLQKLMQAATPNVVATAKKTDGLSKRETEVLQLIAEGLTNAEIAEKLFTSKRTIETHRQNIIEKTQAKNTAALISYAVRQGLLT
ncbi:response regulator transcription factor [Hymenobacter taeanensis]|uniref:Response regulator transcription factor n=1 Tax=Hymenobacter taeanensis TaxID=2735321 RepID=A0A6M6BBU7_9BACT|nr:MULTISPECIES: response regulator transcription factor [Hymenobacter]QJX45479.1 response regulator transcription factor [Hymenobacter taeanensis]UOQ81273.1 response regulator transcription factor [Hymenobacter sp. 5414T-23]